MMPVLPAGFGTWEPFSVPLCSVGVDDALGGGVGVAVGGAVGEGVESVTVNFPSGPRVTDPCSKVTAVPPATAWTPLLG